MLWSPLTFCQIAGMAQQFPEFLPTLLRLGESSDLKWTCWEFGKNCFATSQNFSDFSVTLLGFSPPSTARAFGARCWTMMALKLPSPAPRPQARAWWDRFAIEQWTLPRSWAPSWIHISVHISDIIRSYQYHHVPSIIYPNLIMPQSENPPNIIGFPDTIMALNCSCGSWQFNTQVSSAMIFQPSVVSA